MSAEVTGAFPGEDGRAWVRIRGQAKPIKTKYPASLAPLVPYYMRGEFDRRTAPPVRLRRGEYLTEGTVFEVRNAAGALVAVWVRDGSEWVRFRLRPKGPVPVAALPWDGQQCRE